jgi:hypothetical protein
VRLSDAWAILSGGPDTGAAPAAIPLEPAPRPNQYPDAITREIAVQKAAMWISREAETIPGVRKALHVIVGTISTLKLSAWKGKVKLPVEAFPWLQQPDPARTSQTLLSATVRDLIWHDRCIWRDLGGNQYQRVRPDRVAPVSPDPNAPDDAPDRWSISGVEVPASRLVVFDGAGMGGLRKFGAPLLEMYLRLMEAAARNADDPVPLGNLKNTGSEELPDDDIDRLLDRWEQARAARATGYLGRFLEYEIPGYSPRDMQLVEITEAITKDVARLFGLPGYYLGVDDGSSTTYANVVDRRRDLLESLNPWSSIITQTLSMNGVRYYVGPTGVTSTRVGLYVPYGTHIEFDTSDFERDAFSTRVATLAQAIAATGVDENGTTRPLMYVDEARDLEPLIATP